MGVGTGVTLGADGLVGTAVVCGCGVMGVVDATGVGCPSCAGLVGAGCDIETQGLAGICSMVVVVSGTMLAGLTLHSHRSHLVWW